MIRRFANWLLKKFCNPIYYTDIRGDMEEAHEKMSCGHPKWICDWNYLKEVILLFRWSLIREIELFKAFSSTPIMLRNYLVVAWRMLRKNAGYTAINITGLSLGIGVFIISYLFVVNELSYDRYHTSYDRVYRITNSEKVHDHTRYRVGIAYPAARVLKDNYPGIEKAGRLMHHSDYLGLPLIQLGDNSFLIEKMSWTDPEIFEILSFDFIEGNPATCLDDLQNIVINEKIARRLFGDESAIGQKVNVHFDRDNDSEDLMESYTMQISGVVKDLPANTHLDFDVLGNIRFSNFENWSANNWYYQAYPTYVKLRNNNYLSQLRVQLPRFVKNYFDPKIRDRLSLYMQPISDIRLGSLPGDPTTNLQSENIRVISFVAILVLLLACINYMNLSTARYTRRAREVGLRKVIGARRGQLVVQFLMESFVVTSLALMLSLGLAYAVLPYFNYLMDSHLTIDLFNWEFISLVCLIGLGVSLFAGFYPSILMTSFKPVSALKGLHPGRRGNATIRRGLVVVQFTVTMALLISIGTIYFQMAYLQNLELDIKKEQYLFLRSKEEVFSNLETFERFKRTLERNPSVIETSGTWSLPFGVNAPVFFYPFLPDGYENAERFHMHLFRADHDFLKTFDIDLIAGRDFSRSFATDPTSAFILNETAVKELGWSNDEAVGKSMEVFSGGGNSFKQGKVIGVVSDFNFLSMHNSVKPLTISMVNNQRYRYIAIKIDPKDIIQTVNSIEKTWSEFVPLWPPELFFMEEEWKKNYEQEEKLAESIKYLTIIGLMIACLGLFGLASFTAERKEKEIGIRKVLGATVTEIMHLITREYILLVFIAFILAAPIGWIYSDKWLDQFAYRIESQWWMYLAVIACAWLITILTVAYHSIKASLSNPATVLRNE